jgi:proteasome beta subunit
MTDMKHKKGTTTVGVICKDGVVLAADQLATMGDFKANTDVQKIYPLAKNIAMTTAGSVGDNLAIVRVLSSQMKLFELEIGQPTVKAAVTLMANMLSDKYLYSYLPYHLQNLMAGYDTEPRLFSIDLIGAIIPEKKYAATGSGMVVAYGILDSGFKPGMSMDDGVKLATKSIVAARARVSSVGGENITVLKITSKGIEEVDPNKILAITKSK